MTIPDIKPALKKLLPDLLKAKQDQLNEADTVIRIIKVFTDVLGYDVMKEITREQQVKNKYVDIAIKLDGRIRLLIEVKSANNILRDRYVEQAERYASEGNYQWVLLTTGVEWSLYHLTFEDGIAYDTAWHCSLETDALDDCCALLSLLHRKSLDGTGLEDYWEHKKALDIPTLGAALFTEDVIDLLRKEIRKKTGIRPDEEDVANAINNMLAVDVRQILGPVKIRKNRKPRQKAIEAVSGESAPSIAESKSASILNDVATQVRKITKSF